jgi:hypothetical protein
VPCDAVDAAVAPAAVANPTSLFVADEYDVNVGVVGDNINISEGAKVICMVISPYKLVSIMLVDALLQEFLNIVGLYNYLGLNNHMR